MDLNKPFTQPVIKNMVISPKTNNTGYPTAVAISVDNV